jgi:hypothetical protein
MENDFLYKVVFFKQPGCVACGAMEPIWSEVAGELAESHPHYNIGFGTWDVTQDDWEFCDFVQCDGTPNFAVLDKDNELLRINTDGVLAASQLKDFILNAIEGSS